MFQLQCFPLYSLLLAMGSPTVHLLVLDVEGAETLILRTIPWDKIDIEVSGSVSGREGRGYCLTHSLKSCSPHGWSTLIQKHYNMNLLAIE